ncbi:MAG TPA: toxin-antitoxin system HicB family antitoxin [Fimbriimonadaceae bacterium]|nr:toxin-antitoxin system HicB family antitoxin [Fimbriimonadaceae bacterium]
MRQNARELDAALVTAPGESISEELRHRGLTLEEFATRAGVPTEEAEGVVLRGEPMSEAFAGAVGRFFGTSAGMWIEMERRYREFADRQARSYSGNIAFRGPKDLHRRLTEMAESEGISVNQLVLYLVTDALARREAS